MERLKIAVDFDGTVVDHRFPDIGPNVPYCITVLKELIAQGHKIILNTMRSGEYLDAAVKWFEDRNITLSGINNDPEQINWTTSTKTFAHMYIDDAAFGCPMITSENFNRPAVDWKAVASYFNIPII